MRELLLMLGLHSLSLDQLFLLASTFVICAGLLGWMSDLVLGENGFGVIGNAVVIVASSLGGVLVWRRYGVPLDIGPGQTMALVAALSSLTALIGCGLLRRAI